MSKPIKFVLEFSGYQHLRIEDGELSRPAAADEVAKSIAQFLQSKCDECRDATRGKMKFTVKRIA